MSNPSEDEIVHFNYQSSIKKGRFSIENAKTENFTEKFGSFRRGRFTVNYTEVENRSVLEILEGQQRQMEILFDMIRENNNIIRGEANITRGENNVSGQNQLFYREFQQCTEEVEGNIEKLRKLFEFR